MSDEEIRKEIAEIKTELERLDARLDKIAVGAAQAALDTSNRLGVAVKRRFEAVESIIAILAQETSPTVQQKVRKEASRLRSTFLSS